jgi:glucose/arabinose dehydrogenase
MGIKLSFLPQKKSLKIWPNRCKCRSTTKADYGLRPCQATRITSLGDSKPNDKIIILEDTNNDGKADKQTVFADGLHLPLGFEIAKEGVYVSQGTNLKLFTDTNGDDKADKSGDSAERL